MNGSQIDPKLVLERHVCEAAGFVASHQHLYFLYPILLSIDTPNLIQAFTMMLQEHHS